LYVVEKQTSLEFKSTFVAKKTPRLAAEVQHTTTQRVVMIYAEPTPSP
jgi:hypothetical protein